MLIDNVLTLILLLLILTGMMLIGSLLLALSLWIAEIRSRPPRRGVD